MTQVDLSAEELITYIMKNKSKNISLSSEEVKSSPLNILEELYDFLKKEKKLKKTLKAYSNSLSAYSKDAQELLKSHLNSYGIEEEHQKEVKNIFKKTVLTKVDKVAEKILNSHLEEKFLSYSEILLEETTTILDSILAFKNTIDKNYPGLCDKIISAAVPVIVSLVTIYHPPIGLALQTTGVLNVAAEFVKTENLEKVSGKMHSSLNEIKETRYLKEAQELGEKLSELSEILDVSPYSLQKAGINLENFESVKQEVTNQPEAGEFLKKVCEYAEDNIPNHEKDVERFFEIVKEEAIETLKTKEASKELIEDFKTLFDQTMIDAEVKMKGTTKQSAPIFDKIADLQLGAEMIITAEEKILKTLSEKHPTEKDGIAAAIKVVNSHVNEGVRKDKQGLKEIADLMTKDTKAKTLARNHLGSGMANELVIKNALKKEVNLTRRR